MLYIILFSIMYITASNRSARKEVSLVQLHLTEFTYRVKTIISLISQSPYMLTSVSETDETSDNISSSKIISPEHIESNKRKAQFDLLPNEEEEKLLAESHRLPLVPELKRIDGKYSKAHPDHVSTSPSLRSVSLPKGPITQRACTSPQLQHATSVGNVNGMDGVPCNMPHGGTPTEIKKPKKLVSDYYKKQNELLENFRNDSEQIQVSCVICLAYIYLYLLLFNLVCLRAKHEAMMDKARATSKAASRLAHITLFVNISLMVAKRENKAGAFVSNVKTKVICFGMNYNILI
uniref:Uncharacterized protein n=1 Tax=Heterorhabditis bacteriophora TaxID=37862 RepID=A0A1I7XAP8_HETBA